MRVKEALIMPFYRDFSQRFMSRFREVYAQASRMLPHELGVSALFLMIILAYNILYHDVLPATVSQIFF